MRIVGTLDVHVRFQVVEDTEGQPEVIWAVTDGPTGSGSNNAGGRADDATNATYDVREAVERKLFDYIESLDAR